MKSRFLCWIFVLGLSLAGCAAHSDQEYNARVREIQGLQAQLNTITNERTRLNAELARIRTLNEQMINQLRQMGADVSRLQANNAETQTELDATRRRAEELQRQQQQAQQRLATFQQMIERFRNMINAGQLRVRIVRGRMVIELPAGILFDSGDARLRAAGEEVLRQVAQVLRQIPDRDFLIAGHTDNVQLGRGGRYHDNWELSSQRAVNVVRFLQTNGMDAAHLGAAGYAEFEPAGPNDTEDHRAQNRRVEIVLMPNINELPDLSSLESTTPPAGGTTTTPAPAPSGTAPAPSPAH